MKSIRIQLAAMALIALAAHQTYPANLLERVKATARDKAIEVAWSSLSYILSNRRISAHDSKLYLERFLKTELPPLGAYLLITDQLEKYVRNFTRKNPLVAGDMISAVDASISRYHQMKFEGELLIAIVGLISGKNCDIPKKFVIPVSILLTGRPLYNRIKTILHEETIRSYNDPEHFQRCLQGLGPIILSQEDKLKALAETKDEGIAKLLLATNISKHKTGHTLAIKRFPHLAQYEFGPRHQQIAILLAHAKPTIHDHEGVLLSPDIVARRATYKPLGPDIAQHIASFLTGITIKNQARIHPAQLCAPLHHNHQKTNYVPPALQQKYISQLYPPAAPAVNNLIQIPGADQDDAPPGLLRENAIGLAAVGL